MISTSQAYRDAIVGSPRLIELLAVVDISDPDKAMLPVTCSTEAAWSKKEQLYDYDLTGPPRYATLEPGRAVLDGTFDVFPADYVVPTEVGYASQAMSGADGSFDEYPWVQLNFSGVRVLQAISIFFSTDPADGVPMDFTVEVFQGTTAYFTKEITGNAETDITIDGFTVYNPVSIKLTVGKWSLPYRRVRLVEMTTGLFERWSRNDLAEFNATLQGQFSCLSIPYGSVTLAMDNADRRFEPRKKDSIFQSIEERQSVELFIGCQTAQGMERVKLGVFYQAGDGWKTSSNELTMQWYLVDIIGLVSGRTFIPPSTLPTTLGGWIKAVVSQLGPAFENLWHVDPAYTNASVTADSTENVAGSSCGDIIRWACQASGTWPRADQTTGKLTAEPLWNQGNKYTLDNLISYPTMKANESLAALIFQIEHNQTTTDPETGETNTERVVDEYVVSGNSTTSEKTVTIKNPFIHSSTEALAAARLILSQYGGNQIELTGRGDPSTEIGDVATVWLDESSATTARVMSQTFQFQDGVMQNCRLTGLQADGSYLWENYAVIRESGTWTAPPGVHQLRIVLGRGGQGSGPGGPGYYTDRDSQYGEFAGYDCNYGDPGVDGIGGEIWYGVIDCNEEQEFTVTLGAGGAPGTVFGSAGSFGGHTYFGSYSSENGQLYENGYTDIANGQVFARSGVPIPAPGTGDGAKGGGGGTPPAGYRYGEEQKQPDGSTYTWYYWQEETPPGPGEPGKAGGTGFAMVTWEKPET